MQVALAEDMEAAPRGQEMERARTGSVEFLGRWNDKRDDRAMAVKLSVSQRKDTNTAKIDTVAIGKRRPDAQLRHQCISRPAVPVYDRHYVLGRRHGHTTRMR